MLGVSKTIKGTARAGRFGPMAPTMTGTGSMTWPTARESSVRRGEGTTRATSRTISFTGSESTYLQISSYNTKATFSITSFTVAEHRFPTLKGTSISEISEVI
jgi:hypothetical protein